MIKLVVATVAAFFAVLLVFGDETRRVEVSEKKRGPAFEFSLASFIPQSKDIGEIRLEPVSALSDEEAVKIAIETGETLRAKRSGTYEGDIVAAAALADTVSSVDAPATDFWYVSGTRVNLRAGPGTVNAVVASLTFGTEAEVLSDTGADWIEIRTADGTAGWISSIFLTETAPG